MHSRATMQIAATLLLATGCVTVRHSSRDHLAGPDASLDLPRPPDAVAEQVVAAFSRRGFHLVDRQATSEAVSYRFKGARSTATTVSGYMSGGSGWVGGQSEAIGSVFYATLQASAGGTRVWFFGRPTVQGREPCEPPDADFPCDGTVQLVPFSSAMHLVSGREEAEALRGLMLEVGGLQATRTAPAAAAPAAVPAPATPPTAPAQALDGAPPVEFVRATLRAGAVLRTAPDEAAPEKGRLSADEAAWVVPEPTRGHRRARTDSGLTGFAAEADVQAATR